MATYRAQIIWDFEFDEKGITQNEYDYLDEDEDFTRSPEEMARYAKSELYEYLSDFRNNFWDSIDVIEIKE